MTAGFSLADLTQTPEGARGLRQLVNVEEVTPAPLQLIVRGCLDTSRRVSRALTEAGQEGPAAIHTRDRQRLESQLGDMIERTPTEELLEACHALLDDVVGELLEIDNPLAITCLKRAGSAQVGRLPRVWDEEEIRQLPLSRLHAYHPEEIRVTLDAFVALIHQKRLHQAQRYVTARPYVSELAGYNTQDRAPSSQSGKVRCAQEDRQAPCAQVSRCPLSLEDLMSPLPHRRLERRSALQKRFSGGLGLALSEWSVGEVVVSDDGRDGAARTSLGDFPLQRARSCWRINRL